MKIAFVSDNGTTISRHFGRARQYVVVTIAEGQEVSREVRAKAGCHDHHGHGHHDQAHHDQAHHDQAHHDQAHHDQAHHDHDHHEHGHHDHDHHEHGHHDHGHHDDMLQVIADCEVLIAGGMGTGMDQRLGAVGMRAIRTRMHDIDMALQQFLAGRLGDTIELVH